MCPGCVRWLDMPVYQWHNTVAKMGHGGVGAPVGLTVFKTAGGSLGAAPGGFDSHTPLPVVVLAKFVPVFLPIGFGDFQNYASQFALQNYASHPACSKIHF
jgi:hypothetical protein